MKWILKYIKHAFSQQQNVLKSMKILNVVQFISVAFKPGVHCLKIALCGLVMPKHVSVKCLLYHHVLFVCLFGTLNGGKCEMLMCDLLQREVWFCFTSRNENPLGKMSRWNCFLTLSKLSPYPLPIHDDEGSNCCRNTRNYLISHWFLCERTSLH